MSDKDGLYKCWYCDMEHYEDDIGICVACGVEVCVSCAIYNESTYDGWICEDCKKDV